MATTTTPETSTSPRKRIAVIAAILAAVVGIAIGANAYQASKAKDKADRAMCDFIESMGEECGD